jgi:hypothetical protein
LALRPIFGWLALIGHTCTNGCKRGFTWSRTRMKRQYQLKAWSSIWVWCPISTCESYFGCGWCLNQASSCKADAGSLSWMIDELR